MPTTPPLSASREMLASPVTLAEALLLAALLARSRRVFAIVLVLWFAAWGLTYEPARQATRVVASRPWNLGSPFFVTEMPRPRPSPGTVVIEVHATSVNPVDFVRSQLAWIPFARWYVPPAQLQDVSGVVVQSACVDSFRVGDSVFGISTRGALAETVAVSCSSIAKKPADVTHEQAASLPTVALPGVLLLNGRITPETTILVVGASSGCGQWAAKYARAAGAKRIACVASAARFDRAKRSGCDPDLLFDYRAPDFVDRVSAALRGRVDVVYDAVGSFETSDYYPILVERAGVLRANATRGAKTFLAVNGQISDWLALVATRLTGRLVDFQRPGMEFVLEPVDVPTMRVIAEFASRTLPDVGRVMDGLDPDALARAMRDVRGKHPDGKLVFRVRGGAAA